MTTQALIAKHAADHSVSYSHQLVITRAPVIVADVMLALAAFSIAVLTLSPGRAVWDSFPGFLFAVGTGGLATGMFRIIGVYPISELRQIVTGILLSLTFLVAASFLFAARTPLAVLVLAHLVLAITMPVMRALVRSELAKTSWWGVRCLVFGCDRRINRLFKQHIANRSIGLIPFGFVEPRLSDNCDSSLRSCYVGNESIAAKTREQLNAHAAIVHRHGRSDAEVGAYVEQHLTAYSHVAIVPDDVRLPISWNSHATGQVYENKVLDPFAKLVKRVLDLSAALAVVILASPVLLALAAWTYISSPGPIFFGHERIGKDGRRFKVWKFRTMVTNAQDVLEKYLAENPEAQAEWDATYKLQNDPRVTTVGHLLRKTSLDELPQLWNVIKGEMSLVGPRPIVTGEIERYADSYETYLSVQPGITGFWQVSGRNLTTYDRRVELDHYYVRNWSIWFDLYVLGRTVKTVICREGAF